DAAQALAEFNRICRFELAPGEYRAECPECGAAQSIPGGWAGERFDCRRCAKALEVLFYDDASRYATTATVAPPARPEPPPILFLEEEQTSVRARKFCLKCGGEMRPEAKTCRQCGAEVVEQARRVMESARRDPRPAPAPRSYVAPAIVTFFSYFLF